MYEVAAYNRVIYAWAHNYRIVKYSIMALIFYNFLRFAAQFGQCMVLSDTPGE